MIHPKREEKLAPRASNEAERVARVVPQDLWFETKDLGRYSGCGRRGLSRGAIGLFVDALVVEFRPFAAASS